MFLSMLMVSTDHLGDLLGVSLETDVSILSRESFTPMQRVALTANGNLQRILSSYHNRPVKVQVLRNEQVKSGVYEREVILTIDNEPCCVANSTVRCLTEEASKLIDAGSGIGQVFATLGAFPGFSLQSVGKTAKTFKRAYTLASSAVICEIKEEMPLNLFGGS